MDSLFEPTTYNGMIMGALIHGIGFFMVRKHRGGGKFPSNGVMIAQLLTGAIGGGLGAMVSTTWAPGNSFAFVAAVVLGVMTYDHFLVM